MPALTQPERQALLGRAWELERQLYPEDRSQAPQGRPAARLREGYYQILAEYADRLPRIVFSACPFTGEPLKHSFDPWGLDGPWWHMDREVEIEEPKAPAAFKALLGAVALRGRKPREARDPVLAGPDVPFVVPRLLGLPGMVAVVSCVELATGDLAYPVAYYSTEEIPQRRLHQFWLQQEHWFELEGGKSGWLIANDVWDFDLLPWIQSGKLRWIAPGDPEARVVDGRVNGACPFVGLPGERLPQSIAAGERSVLELPDGTPINPFED
jgi:hypothetical protein